MDPVPLLARYDAEVRERPYAAIGQAVEEIRGVVLLTGEYNFVTSWRFQPDAADATVATVVARFRGGSGPLIWRVHQHDGPTGIEAVLAAHGFVAEPAGTLMMSDLSVRLAGATADVEVRRVETPADLDDFVAAANDAFGDDITSRRRDAYAERLLDPGFSLYVAYLEGRPAATGRLESAPGGAFGLLFGGGVRPTFRGRGLYRALVHARAAEARVRGARFLATDARDMSRPILERMGFAAVARETTWVLAP